MANKLEGKKIAILVEEGFEQVELTKPLQALKDEGAEAHIISPNQKNEINAWNHTEWGDEFKVDRKLSDVKAED
jgi:protease I